MSKKLRFEIEYLGGIWQASKPKKGSVSVDKDGLMITIGYMSVTGDIYFIPWGQVVAVNLTGSSNPAFQSVPRYLTGIPGLQTMSTKSLRTGAKCFVAIGYTGISRLNFPKATSREPNTIRMYALDMNQADIETHFAQYMHIVDRNAQQFAALQEVGSPKPNSKSRPSKPKFKDQDSGDLADDNREGSSPGISKSLRELATMYEEGLLTKKEFEQAKKKLLQ